MKVLRFIAIAYLIVFWILSCNGCVSRPTSSGTSENAAIIDATGRADSTFFRHRWWNYYKRGLVYAEDRELTQAIADFSTAIDQREGDQRLARTYGMHLIDYFPSRELGVAYYETGQLKAAQEALDRSIASYPSAKALFYLDLVRRAIIQESGRLVSPPQVELEFAAPEIWTRDDPIVIKGTAWDDNYVHNVTVNSDPLNLEGSQQRLPFETLVSLPEGRHKVTVAAINLMGRITQRTVTINVDRQGPLIVVEHISPKETEHGLFYDIRGMVTDAAGVLKVGLNNVPMTLQIGPAVPFQFSLPADENRIYIKAIDHLGNITTAVFEMDKHMLNASRQVLLAVADGMGDNSALKLILGRNAHHPPEIKLKDWTDDQTVYLDRVYIDGVVSDPNDVVRLTINQSLILYRSAKMAYFNHIVPLVEGISTISVKATNGKGDQSEKRIIIRRKIPVALKLDARMKVTVLPFQKQGGISAASFSFQAHLLDALFRQNRFRLVERNLLDVILQEQKLSQTALMDQKTALRVGRMAAAQSILAGDIIETRKGIEIVSRMIDTETSDILSLEDVYSETKDKQSIQALANGMAIKYHRDFPLTGGSVVSKKGKIIITDMGEQEIKLQRCILVYKESPIHHTVSGKVLGVDAEILCRARITMVDKEISKARLLDVPSDDVRISYKVIAE